ncbi:MAG: hypothetical protein HQ580_09065 [Planctomycetes bacterium]|nr:hypothetical protein [Planctomycetota bacterium]
MVISIWLLWNISKPAKFHSSNYKRFLDGCTSLIARGNEPDLRELADEIFDSIEGIVKECKKYNSGRAHLAKEKGERYEISEYTKYVLTLLDLWSDAKFCQLMVCYVPKTANEIFTQINKQGLYYSGGYALVHQLVRQAFMNKTSILYKEEDYFGLGHFKTFTNTVFGNCELIESNLNPLPAWRGWNDESLGPWMIEKYTEALNVATEAHIAHGWRKGYHHGLSQGFNELIGMGRIVWSQAVKLDKLHDDDEIVDSLPWKNLFAIERGLDKTVGILQEHEENIPEYRLDEATYNKFEDGSIYGVIAYAIFGFFENLSVCRSKDETVRMLAISLWMAVYPVSKGQETKAIVELQKRLNIHLFKKFEENLKELHYPALIRLWINIASLQENIDERRATLVNKKLFELLRKYYEKAVKTDPKKAKDMLPDKIRYDEKKGQLIQTYTFGSTSVLELR